MTRKRRKKINEQIYQNKALVGDIIVSLGTSWVAGFIAWVTRGEFGGNSMNHVGIVSHNEFGELCIIEALQRGVVETSFRWHWEHTKKWIVVRLGDYYRKSFNPTDIVERSRHYIGTPYAFRQLLDDWNFLMTCIGVGKREAYKRALLKADPRGVTCTEFVGQVYESLGIHINPMGVPRFLLANDFLSCLGFDTIMKSDDLIGGK